MSLADELVSLLQCPGCSHQKWDLRAEGVDDLPRLEGTLCCGNCGQAFAARGGVLDMVPGIVEDRLTAMRRRIESPPVAKLYEETLRHIFTPLSSPLRNEDRHGWLRQHRSRGEVRHIIDLGCGRGSDLRVMREVSSPSIAVGIDLSQVLLAEAARDARTEKQKNVCYIRANLESMPFVEAAFGWASCYGVLHRLAEPAQALAQMSKLLEPDGVFTCLTTCRLPAGSLLLGQQILGIVGRIHLFGSNDLEGMLDKALLDLIELKTYGPVALLAAKRTQG